MSLGGLFTKTAIEKKNNEKRLNLETTPSALGMSTQHLDRVINNFIKNKRRLEETGKKYLRT